MTEQTQDVQDVQTDSLGKRMGMRVVKNLSLLLIEIGIIVGIFMSMSSASPSKFKGILIAGIIAQLIFASVIFFSKKLRTKLTIWWAILALLTGGFWVFLLIGKS